MQSKGFLCAGALAFGLAAPAIAEGLSFSLEGGLGFNRGENVGIFSLVRTPPASATSQLDYYGGMPRGPLSFSYRAEGKWAFDLGNGTQMRLGGILSGLSGTSHETTPVYYLISARPGGPEPSPPEAEIRVCQFPNPCAVFEGELSRSYHEVMPELMFGREGAAGTMTWLGLKGFSGQFSEDTSNSARNVPGANFVFSRTTLTELDADISGMMLTVEQERKLASGMTLLLGAGLGRYDGDATGLSVDPNAPLGAKPVSGSFDGTRAQLSVGFEKPIRKGMSLGATIRADYWSDQPRIQTDWGEAPCTPSICEPPARTGNFDLTTDPYLSLSVGLSLTFRM